MDSHSSFSKRFQRLRWRLTLNYMGVTVGVLVTLELILLGAMVIWLVVLVNSGTLPELLIEAGSQYTPALRTYLSQTPPDEEGIAASLEWITDVTTPTIPLSFDATDELLVVGADGTLLGSTSPNLSDNELIGQPFDPQSVLGSADPLQAALAGTEDVERLYSLENSGGQVVMAMPVWDADHQHVLGAVIAVTEAPTGWSIIGELLPVLGFSLLVFTITAGLTGIPFGYLAARGLVKRFDRLAEVTLAWSKGDFSVLVDDPSRDELGQLARRLNSMADQLQTLLDTRRELAVVEERNRLARDLHDSVKQQAFAAAAQLDAVQALMGDNPAAAADHVNKAVHLIDDLRHELTGLIQELRPAALQDKGLVAALQDYTARWSEQTEIISETRVQGERALGLEIEQSIFRIIQEALANAARHSQATHVEILLTYNTDVITLTIHDNGQGFQANSKNRGLGLHSMRERAESLGGELIVESRPGHGARLMCSVPVNSTRKADTEQHHE